MKRSRSRNFNTQKNETNGTKINSKNNTNTEENTDKNASTVYHHNNIDND